MADGLVVEVPNKGVFVKEITLRDIEEIFDLRVLMENYAISRLRNNLTSSGIERLLSCQTQLEQAYLQDDLRRYTQIDAELHELFIKLSGNSLLESMYGRMLSLFQQFRIYSLLSRKRFDESNDEHKNIVHCLLLSLIHI